MIKKSTFEKAQIRTFLEQENSVVSKPIEENNRKTLLFEANLN